MMDKEHCPGTGWSNSLLSITYSALTWALHQFLSLLGPSLLNAREKERQLQGKCPEDDRGLSLWRRTCWTVFIEGFNLKKVPLCSSQQGRRQLQRCGAFRDNPRSVCTLRQGCSFCMRSRAQADLMDLNMQQWPPQFSFSHPITSIPKFRKDWCEFVLEMNILQFKRRN